MWAIFCLLAALSLLAFASLQAFVPVWFLRVFPAPPVPHFLLKLHCGRVTPPTINLGLLVCKSGWIKASEAVLYGPHLHWGRSWATSFDVCCRKIVLSLGLKVFGIPIHLSIYILSDGLFLASEYVDRPNILKLIHPGSYLSNLWVFSHCKFRMSKRISVACQPNQATGTWSGIWIPVPPWETCLRRGVWGGSGGSSCWRLLDSHWAAVSVPSHRLVFDNNDKSMQIMQTKRIEAGLVITCPQLCLETSWYALRQ